MLKRLVILLLSLVTTPVCAAEIWQLDHSAITYTVHHPLKTASGTSKEAKGKGRCDKEHCEFLIGVPVKSFDSGDSNRDLHMLEVTRGGANPMVVVNSAFDPKAEKNGKLPLTLKVDFAGKQATYRDVPFEVAADGGLTHVKGTLTIRLSDFAISPPSLLTLPIKDEVPIEIDSFWKK